MTDIVEQLQRAAGRGDREAVAILARDYPLCVRDPALCCEFYAKHDAAYATATPPPAVLWRGKP